MLGIARHLKATEKIISIAFVVGLHTLICSVLFHQSSAANPLKATTLFIRMIAPPSPAKPEEPKSSPLEKNIQVEPPRPNPAQLPAIKSIQLGEKPQAQETATNELLAAAIEMPVSDDSVTLSSELAVVCANRTAPRYPPLSRQLREEGSVLLSVELSDNGSVDKAYVRQSSGFPRLDEAALAAVKNWRCDPAVSNGKPQRAVALQPFTFQLKH